MHISNSPTKIQYDPRNATTYYECYDGEDNEFTTCTDALSSQSPAKQYRVAATHSVGRSSKSSKPQKQSVETDGWNFGLFSQPRKIKH